MLDRAIVRLATVALTVVASLFAYAANAQLQLSDLPAPVISTGEFPLKTRSAAPATLPEGWIAAGNARIVHNVSKPTLTPFLPPKGTGNGTAVVIAPGGGFMMLSMSSEGWDVARWLANHGIAAFVLKYRLAATPATARETAVAIASVLGSADRSKHLATGAHLATEDALEAMREVRRGAAKWGIDPNKIGFMGFSAGAYTTLSLVGAADATTMPNFVAPIYGPLGAPLYPIPAAPPPMWSAISADDPAVPPTQLILPSAWRAKGGSVEFHMYEKGGHGYGFAGTPGTTSVNWPTHFLNWLESRGLYKSSGTH